MKTIVIDSTVSNYSETATVANIREYIRTAFDLKTCYTAHHTRAGYDICIKGENEIVYTITII